MGGATILLLGNYTAVTTVDIKTQYPTLYGNAHFIMEISSGKSVSGSGANYWTYNAYSYSGSVSLGSFSYDAITGSLIITPPQVKTTFKTESGSGSPQTGNKTAYIPINVYLYTMG